MGLANEDYYQMINYRREIQLLLCTARSSMDSKRAERIGELLATDIDYEWLIGTALQHGVMPLLYINLHNTHPGGIPREIMAEMRSHFEANTRRNLLLTGELLELLNLFGSHGVSAFPFKGPVLASSIYGNLTFRQFVDLDIVVQKQDFLKAKELLISVGYQPRYKATGSNEAGFLLSHNEAEFVRHDGKVSVDLHWGFTLNYSFLEPNLEWFLPRIVPVLLAGTVVHTFSTEDLILLLCLHGAKDGWERLLWVCDLAELLEMHDDINWTWTFEQAHRMGMQRMLFVGLFLAYGLLGAVIQSQILTRMQSDPIARRLAIQVCQSLFAEADSSARVIKRFTFFVGMLDRPRDKARYCYHRMLYRLTPTPNDWDFIHLPSYLSFMYGLIRPVRQLRDFARKPLNRQVNKN